MNTRQAIAERIIELSKEHGIAINALAHASGVPPMTVYSILNAKSKNPGIINIKKLCDGFGITLGQFFNTCIFDNLEQEVQ